MKRIPASILAALSLACAHPTFLAAAESSGTVEGRVFNAATGAALANARVRVEGTDREAITDAAGSYRLNLVPAGERVIAVFYVGLGRQEARVQVAPGGVAQRDFELASPPADGRAAPADQTVRMDAFSVVANSVMSAQSLAMNEQRHAANIKNVVAIDEFGDRGQENVGEYLHFLPGISVDVPGDSGPGSVSVRGFPPINSTFMLDSGEVAGARGDTRAASLQDVPMLNVSRIEVTKVPTPDMPASGLGGTVNLITKSGFETKTPVLTYDVYTQFNSSNGLTFKGPRGQVPGNSPDYIQPSYSLSYLRPINKRLAVSAAVSRTWRLKSHDDDARDEIPTWDLISGFQRTSVWQAPVQLYKTLSGQFGVDLKVGENGTLSGGVQYREYSMLVTRSQLNVNYGAGATGNAEFTQGAATGVGTATQGSTTSGWYEHDSMTRQYHLKYRHRANGWQLDTAVNLSLADYAKWDIGNGFFFTVPATIPNLIIRGNGIPASGGVPTRYSATTRTGAPVDLFNGGNYSINSATSNQIQGDTSTTGGRADLTREFAAPLPFTVKTGVAVSQMDRDRRVYNRTWNFRPNGSTDATARLASNFPVFDEGFIRSAPTVFGTPLRDISLSSTYDLYRQRPDWFVLDEPAAYQADMLNSTEFTERISAAYLRADVRLLSNRLWIAGGVRYERTDVEGRGPLDDINAMYQRNASGDFIRNAAGQRILITTDPLAQRRLRYKERAAQAERDYGDFYPSMNASFELTNDLIVRAAYARTIGRPNISSIVPGTVISDDEALNPTIRVNNTGLVPWTADSFDLTLESYNFKGGFGTIGVFSKSIDNFFGELSTNATPELLASYGLPTDGSLADYQIVTQRNAGSARIRGLEFGYRQSLTFLPHWARGFQVFLNATKLRLSGDATADFSGFNPSSVAGGVNFVRPRYFIKMTYSYQGETRRGAVGASAANGIPAGTFNYQGKRSRLGLSVQYSFHKRFALYGLITDLGGFELLNRQYAPSTPDYARGNRIQDLGYYTTLGLKGTF